MLFNENFPGQNITMTLKKLTKICPLYCAFFAFIILLLSTNLFLLEQYFKTSRQQQGSIGEVKWPRFFETVRKLQTIALNTGSRNV